MLPSDNRLGEANAEERGIRGGLGHRDLAEDSLRKQPPMPGVRARVKESIREFQERDRREVTLYQLHEETYGDVTWGKQTEQSERTLQFRRSPIARYAVIRVYR
jgi:hypothetical protein